VPAVLDFVSHGRNLDGDLSVADNVAGILDGLEHSLRGHGMSWNDVSLLILLNSTSFRDTDEQRAADEQLIETLTRRCEKRGWFPSLMGSTIFSSFYSDLGEKQLDISNGVHLIAVISGVLPRIPVAAEVSPDIDRRPLAGKNVVAQGVQSYLAAATAHAASLDSTTGVLFTSGSGHVAAEEDIDFKECFALGQQLLHADEVDKPVIVGGCSSSKNTPDKPHSQCLYFSVQDDRGLSYEFTYQHAATFAVLPHVRADYLLQHPFRHVDSQHRLKLAFHPKGEYQQGRYYYVESIDGIEPIDFFAHYWDVPKQEMLLMAKQHTAIPLQPKTFLYTIGSSRKAEDEDLWPNVPVWFEEIEGKTMMRLVRAENHDSNFFLMAMGESGPTRTLFYHSEEALQQNCMDVVNTFRSLTLPNERSTIISFLCESRKVLLQQNNSNIEAEHMTDALADQDTNSIGIYLNGEYSVGLPKSIGYHNFSQISAIIPQVETVEMVEKPHSDNVGWPSRFDYVPPVGEKAAPVPAPQADRAGTLPGPTPPYTEPQPHAIPGPSEPPPVSATPAPHASGPAPYVSLPSGYAPGPAAHVPAPAPVGPGPAPYGGVPASGIPVSAPRYDDADARRQAVADMEAAAHERQLAALALERAADLLARLDDARPHSGPQSRPAHGARIVTTGFDQRGRSVFTSDSTVSGRTSAGLPHTEVVYVWGSDIRPSLPAPERQSYAGHFPRPGGARYLLVNLEPDSTPVYVDPHSPEAVHDAKQNFPGLLEVYDDQGMHSSQTVDIAIVLAGEVVLELDDQAQRLLRTGDVVVQNGTRHRWLNQGSVTARIAFVLIGADRRY
jgi:hypothetical protein